MFDVSFIFYSSIGFIGLQSCGLQYVLILNPLNTEPNSFLIGFSDFNSINFSRMNDYTWTVTVNSFDLMCITLYSFTKI